MSSKPPETLVIAPASQTIIDACAATGPCLLATRAEVVQGRTPGLEAIRALAVWNEVIDTSVFDQLPKLELVANFGVGYDKVDVAAATGRQIAVSHTPDVLTEDVADLTVALLLMTVRNLGAAERYLLAGKWSKKAFPLSLTLRERTVGILGFGRIGKAVANRLEAFGVSLAYSGRHRQSDVSYPYYPDASRLAAAVDTLICLLPGGAETRHAINAGVLVNLGPNGVLISVGRGSTVDEPALAEALKNKVIAAAGLDVFENEPAPLPALLGLDNVVLLPHVGSATVHTRAAMAKLVAANIASWLAEGRALTPTPETRAALLLHV